MRCRYAGAVLLVLLAVGQAFAQQPARPAAPVAPQSGTAEEYVIGPEDLLAISVWKNDAMSRVVPVRPDGMISLPLLDDVKAAGLTPMQLRDLVAQKLSEHVQSPAVSVIVNEVRSFKVSVIGEILKPARYELKSRTTILDVLSMAGGFNQFADRKRLAVIRHEGGGKTRRIRVDYTKVVTGDEENLTLKPGDIVIVP